MKHFYQVVLLALAVMSIALLAGCSGGSSSSPSSPSGVSSKATGHLSFAIDWPSKGKGKKDIPAATQSIVIEVQTADGVTYDQTLYANNPATGANPTPTVIDFGAVPVGSYAVSASAYDQPQTDGSIMNGVNGNDIAGAASVGNMVYAGQVTNVYLVLGDVINIPLTLPNNLHLHKGNAYKIERIVGSVWTWNLGTSQVDTTSFPPTAGLVTFSIPSAYSAYASVDANGNVTALKDGTNIEVDVTAIDNNGNPFTMPGTFSITN